MASELDPILALDWDQDLELGPPSLISQASLLTGYPSHIYYNGTHCLIRRLNATSFGTQSDTSAVSVKFEDAFHWWLWHHDYPINEDDEEGEEKSEWISEPHLSLTNGEDTYQTSSVLEVFFPPDD